MRGLDEPGCGNCAYVDDEGYGLKCKRLPPQIVVFQGNLSARHPNVRNLEWCGEHKPVEAIDV